MQGCPRLPCIASTVPASLQGDGHHEQNLAFGADRYVPPSARIFVTDMKPMASFFKLLPVAGFLVCAMTKAGGVYTWKDSRGRTHFGDRLPDRVGAQTIDIRLNTYQSPAKGFRDTPSVLPQGKVLVYTTSRCGYCRKAKAFLAKSGVSYTEYDVETTAKGRRDFRQLQGQGVPIILVGEQRLNGYSELQLSRMLSNAGYTF
jgi:glutaredoxin